MQTKNREAYEKKKVVNNYLSLSKIFPAEQKLLSILEKYNKRDSILDLGIGAGRTTVFLAPLFRTYIGIDYSEKMIEVCENRFSKLENTKFIVADVMNLPQLNLGKFDSIIFSFNGISLLKTIEDRKLLLNYIFNSLNQEGIFAFSTHNVNVIKKHYSFQFPKRNPFKIITEILRIKKLKKINGDVSNYEGKEYFQLYDGSEYFNALVTYTLPSFQVNLLKEAGFSRIDAYDMNGNLISENHLKTVKDHWVHYLCYK